jgi:trimeric autotransporter adhesin
MATLAWAGVGCGSETTDSDGADASDSGTEESGDGDPSTGDGDGDGDPSTGDGDGDPGPVCGNGVVEGDELCDDGNDDDFDACTAECVPSPAQPGTLTLNITAIKQFEFSWAEVYGATYYQILERVELDGEYALVSDGIEAEAVSLTVPLHLRLNASYKLRACNPDGCTESDAVDVSGNLAEAVGYFKASNTDADDWLSSVALSGDGATLALGAGDEDSNATGVGGDQSDNSAADAGAVYVFVREGGVWSQQAYVKASNTGADDTFGYDIALSDDGNTLAVGAINEDSNATGIGGNQADNSTPNAGAVYVFVRSGGVWSQEAYIKASNPGADDLFGYSISMSGDGATLAVGAPAEDSDATGVGGNQADNTAINAGAVYVFARNGGVWSQEAYVKASNTSAGDQFGLSVALSGDGVRLAVGAWAEDSGATGVGGNQADGSVSNAGAVYVYTRNGGAWAQEAYVKASNTDPEDWFGHRVALSDDGTTLAVTAPGEDSDATGVGGDQSGNSASSAGAAYLFVRNGGVWSQEAYVKASNTGAGDEFGSSVALSGDGTMLVVGAMYEHGSAIGIGGDPTDNSASSAGAVYVYARDGGVWSQEAYVKASNTDADDQFGWDVALSNDATTLAVVADYEASNATGVGGDQADNSAVGSGAVYLY